jgi:hypothetical protein
LGAEWLKISEEVACKKIKGCSNVNKLRGLGMYRVRCKWEKEREWKTIGEGGS